MKLLIFLLPLLPLFASSQQVDTMIFKFSNGDIKYLITRGATGVGTDSLYVQHNGVRTVLSPMDLPVNTATGTALDGKATNIGLNGGTTNQFLKKNSATNYDWSWSTIAGGGDLLAANNLSDVANITTAKTNLSLQNLDNTSDANKPVSTAQATAITARGYTLSVQALTSSPADAATIYMGQLPKAPTTTANISKVFIRKAGTIKAANIFSFSGTAGTNEAWVAHIRLNNTTDTQIASVSLATGERVWSNTGLNIAVVVGDYIEIKFVNPSWTTNPLTFIPAGYIYIE